MSSTATSLTLTGPDEILAAIPYLLGYHPSDSFVFLGFCEKRLVVSGRCDLQDPVDTDGIDALIAKLHDYGCDSFIFAGYGPAVLVTATIDAARASCENLGLGVKEALRVTDSRYWSYLCPGADCCPDDGDPVPPPDTRIAATLTAQGLTALPDRAALAAQLDPATADDVETITTIIAAVRVAPDSRQQAEALLAKYTTDTRPGFPDIAETAIILHWLRWDGDLIDAALDRIDDTEPAAHVALWTWLTRHAPSGYRAEPASVLAYAAWRAGDGAFARIAVERALADAPRYRLAHVITELLDTAADPTTTPPISTLRAHRLGHDHATT